MPPLIGYLHQMENPIQTFSTSPQLSTQGYNSHNQLQATGCYQSPVRQNSQAQNLSSEPYPQPVNRYYQASYIPHQNSSEMGQYVNAATPSNHQAYNMQYPASRQSGYTNANIQHSANLKGNYNAPYYGNVAQQPVYQNAENVNAAPQQPNYGTAAFYPSKSAHCSNPTVPQVPLNSSTNPNMQGGGVYVKQQQQNAAYTRYGASYNTYPGDTRTGYGNKQLPNSVVTVSSSSKAVPMMTVTQANGQLSSIPTPPETSGQGDLPCNDGASIDGMTDCGKINQMSSPSFVLPGSAVSQSSMCFPSSNASVATTVSNCTDSSRGANWSNNASVPLQPPPIVDEGSQASSASASSSIPDEQNSMKANSKPNFSYPPTPNTLSSPGAASMSSFHDDLECISSPGWPRTPASPVGPNTNGYEFANIKRPESLLKLYSLSDEPDRRYFLDKLIVFNEDRGSPITQCPTISKQPLDVFRVYLAVKERCGFVEVTNAKRWKDIAGAIGVGASSSAAYTLRKQYMKLLLPFECKYDRGGIDPQPIINQVEASSRKKGKNTASGNANLCMQGYPQGMDGYPPGYQECYPNSRYPYNSNNMDYRYTPNAPHYQQSMQPTQNSPVVNNQQSYGQYPQNNQAHYGYYQRSNSGAAAAVQTETNAGVNRYPTSGRPSPSVNMPESNYYNSNYTMQHNYSSPTSNAYKYNAGNTYAASGSMGTVEECPATTATVPSNRTMIKQEPVTNFEAYSNKNGASKPNAQQDSAVTPKPVENSFDSSSNECSLKSESNSNSSSSNESSYGQSYGPAKPTMQEPLPVAPPVACATPKPPLSNKPAFQGTPPESNKTFQPNCRATPTPPVPPQGGNPTPPNIGPTYPAAYQNSYQQKMPNHPSQYTQYANMSSSESYRGSESYTVQPPMKYNCTNVPKEGAAPLLPSSYPGPNPMSKPAAYGSPVSYSSYEEPVKKEQYQMNYPKDQYNAKAVKGWGPTSTYPYQSSNVMTATANLGQNMSPEKKPFADTQLPFASLESCVRKPPSQPTPNAPPGSIPNKMQHQPNSMTPAHGYMPTVKKPMEFPAGSVEAVKPVYRKRRRYSAKRVTPLDPWRLMLALKSGLLVESTWALDSLSVLLCDNSSTNYFRLSHLPGLLSILVEHYRRFLNKIFGIFDDLEIKRTTASVAETEDTPSKQQPQRRDRRNHGSFNWHKKAKVLECANFTFKTRCKKNVNIMYDEALFLIDPEQKWDVYEGFDVNANHWQMGCGEITDHIQIPFDSESGKVKFARDMDYEKNKNLRDSNNNDSSKEKSFSNAKSIQPPLSCIGDPVIVLKKCNILQKALSKISKPEDKACSDTESSRLSTDLDNDDSTLKVPDVDVSLSSSGKNQNVRLDFRGVGSKTENQIKICAPKTSERDFWAEGTKPEIKVEPVVDKVASKEIEVEEKVPEESCNEPVEASFPRLRCASPLKRIHAEELEDEAYTLDHPSLNLSTEYQEALIRRCLCVSNILRNLSFVPTNDLQMNKNSCLLLVLGRLLLLHHEHKPVKSSHRKYDNDSSTPVEDSCVSLRDNNEWRDSLLHALRDNTLVILSNIAGQLDLTPIPEEISLPILDGLLHWVTCPSSYARDPLPVKPSLSVLTPQRLSLEALCKLSVLDNNVDLMVATPPWSRIDQLFELLVRSLGPVEDKVVKEFSIVLLSSLSQADSSVARAIASQNQCISYLIGFIEQAESTAFQIASTQGAKKLKDNPEIVGTTPNMVQRVANILKSLALVPENRSFFFRHQQRLLTLVTSQIIDQELATIIAEVLFYCSCDAADSSLPNAFLYS